MKFPSNLKYTAEHEWISISGNIAKIGITDFAQKELGDIVYLDISTIGKSVAKNEIFGTIEAVKTVSDLYMPVAGKVLSINPKLDADPQLVNSDPYGDGWMVEVEVNNPDEIATLLSAEDYSALVG
jgi:glycine cleavage system H protein